MEEKYAYHYDEDGVYDGMVVRQQDIVNPEEYLIPGDSTLIAPPECTPPQVALWTGTEWEVIEDHRQHLDETGTPAGGTPYWLPSEGDNWRSEPRYMKELGPLPAGAVTTRPEKTAEEIQQEELQATVNEAESYLNNTDYRVIKFMDKYIQTHPEALAEFEAEYPDTLEKRQEARDNINGAQASAQISGISLV